MVYLPTLDICRLYEQFNAPVLPFNCGKLCSPHNPSGKPFCCDICHAVPAAYHQEWEYLRSRTGLWHVWRGDECPGDSSSPDQLLDETPEHMRLLACRGPAHCERQYRSLSCRQFPFFPYVTSDYRFIGMTYDWEFEEVCWVIGHLDQVSDAYRRQFVKTYDELFAVWQEEFDSYAIRSEETRDRYASLGRRIPLLHRNGGSYLVSPKSERIRKR